MNKNRDKTTEELVRVLMIEANDTDLRTIKDLLSKEKDAHFEVTRAKSLKQGVEKIHNHTFDVVLMDLVLPDNEGVKGCQVIKQVAPTIPLLVITDDADEKLAKEALAQGAQDYIVRGERDPGKLLLLAIHHAIAREQMLVELRSLSMKDELTNIYNRRGFLAFGLEHLKLAKRTGRVYTLIYIDVDGLKPINDTFGHEMGDRVIVETAEILRRTFRVSDICARIGGDEFAVIVIESPDTSAPILRRRLQKTVDDFNKRNELPFPISLSSGITGSYNIDAPSVEDLLRQADESLYEHKRRNRKLPPPYSGLKKIS